MKMRLTHFLIFANGLLNQLAHSASNPESTQLVYLNSVLEGISQPKEWVLQELNGAHLRLSACADPPMVTEQRDSSGNITYQGYIVDIAEYMAEALNATYTFVPVKPADVSLLGPRAASAKLLMTKEVDINTSPMVLTINFCALLDCSLPLFFESTKLMVPWPKEETPIVAPIRPFQDKVWIWLSVSIYFVSITLVLLQKYITKRISKAAISKETTKSNVWNIFTHIVAGEGDWNRWNQLSFRFVQGAWCLAAFVMVNAYCTTLMSYLISPRLMAVAKTYEDVASGIPQKLKLLAEKNDLLALYSLEATSGPFKGLGDLLRRYPESQFTDREKGFEQMFTGEYAYIGVGTRVAIFMAKAFKKADGRCKFTISNENVGRMYPVIWSFSKKWRYTDAFNHKMSWLSESGIVNYLLKKSTPHVESCSVRNHENGSRKILSLRDLSGPFILLAFGLSLSLLVFLIEKVYYNYKLHYSRRNVIVI